MATHSTLSIVSNKSPLPLARFSDYKVKTVSTAERHTVESSSDQSQISEFSMTDRVPLLCGHDKKGGLTFASVKYKQNLQKRIVSFMSSLESMLTFINEKKSKRKNQIHKGVFAYERPKTSLRCKKLTFQMIGSYLRKDDFYNELIVQEHRLEEVQKQILDLSQVIKKIKGGFSQQQIIELMNTINRIQEYCEFLCQTIESLETDLKGPKE